MLTGLLCSFTGAVWLSHQLHRLLFSFTQQCVHSKADGDSQPKDAHITLCSGWPCACCAPIAHAGVMVLVMLSSFFFNNGGFSSPTAYMCNPSPKAHTDGGMVWCGVLWCGVVWCGAMIVMTWCQALQQ
jgi:hypothetical protein